MQITISKRYMKLPVCRYGTSKNLQFYRQGVLAMDFDCHLDPAAPMQWFYYDMRELLGDSS